MMAAPGRQTPTIPAMPQPALQSIAQEDRHVGGVQARQTLADGEQLHKLLIVYPMVLGDQAFAQVRYNPAEAGRTDDEELEENVEDCNFRPRRRH